MNEEFKEDLLALSSSMCIVEVVNITHPEGVIHLVNNNEPVTIDDVEYTPCGMTYTPPSDSSGTLNIDDTDGEITYILQKADSISIEIALINTEDTSYYVDGPIAFTVEDVSISSKGQITMNIASESALSFGASKLSYSVQNFPGLFG